MPGATIRLCGVLVALATSVVAWQDAPAPVQTQPTSTQPAAPPPADPELVGGDLTVESLQALRERFQSAGELPDTARVEIVGVYNQAIEQLRAAATLADKTAEYRRGIEQAVQALEDVRAAAENRPATQPAAASGAGKTLEELTAELARHEAALQAAQDLVNQLEAEAVSRQERRSAIPELLGNASARLQRINSELSSPPPTGAARDLIAARRALLAAQRRAAEAEIAALTEEQRYYEARAPVATKRRETARLALIEQQGLHADWQAYVSARRQQEIEREAQRAEQEARRIPPELEPLARENQNLAESRAKIAAQIDQAQRSLAAIKSEVTEREKADRKLREQLATSEGAAMAGPGLRALRESLLNLGDDERRHQFTVRELSRVVGEKTGYEARVYDLVAIDHAVEQTLNELAMRHGALDRRSLTPRVRELLARQRELLESLKHDYETLESRLRDLSSAQYTRLEGLYSLRDFIDQRVLWIRSADPLYASKPPQDLAQLPARFAAVGHVLWGDAIRNAPLYVFILASVGLLLALRKRLGERILAASERVSRAYSDSYSLTLQTFFSTLLLALPWPVLLSFVGWRMTESADIGDPALYEIALACGQGLRRAAWILFVLSFVRRSCRTKGLSETHFRWNPAAVRRARLAVIALMYTLVPLTLVVAASERFPEPGYRETLGRIGFLAGMFVLLVFSVRLLHPSRGIFAPAARPTWYQKSRHIWFFLAIAFCLMMAAASFVGYHYTAVELSKRVSRTVLILLLIAWSEGMLVRWLFVAQRRMAVEQAKAKRKAALAEAGEEKSDTPEAALIDENALSLLSIGEQTRTLLRNAVALAMILGVWFTWNDMLPALNFLNQVQLWSYVAEIPRTLADGTVQTEQAVRWITLNHVALAMLIGLIVVVLARNLPGLLEITVLKTLPLDPSGRFAITSIARYLIVITGVIIAFGAIGVGWSQVQWLVTAMLVGLGFGLQEIFANFISGLIILAERPIRLGDIVTVNGVTGAVTKMRIRATTIVDWDRKELLIPNKEFVTGQIINWTLSDQILRQVIRVGVGYGSDPEKVQRVLLDIAAENERVLPNPKPRAFFTAFGDSALSFELRVFFKNADELPFGAHELHTEITRRFAAEGIEIAFPQRDLHIRSAPGLENLAGALSDGRADGHPQLPPEMKSQRQKGTKKTEAGYSE